ncbi:MAG: GWxTD domain-containing protein [Bacteroidetes bacterium]|nr:MAG: GWxTD domain-containing protein [Bacteroidota bacterium]
MNKMKRNSNGKTLPAIVLLFLVLLTASNVCSQEERPVGVPHSDLPNFYIDILNYSADSANRGRVDMYIQVPYEMLSFIKSNEQFLAKYEITASVFNTSDALVDEKLWSEEILTRDYRESVSPVTGKISHTDFILPPGEYVVVTQVRDVETKKITQAKQPLTVRNFSQSTLSASDIMVIAQMEEQGEKMVIIPNVAATLRGEEEAIQFYLEAYSQTVPRDVTFLLVMKNKIGETVRSDTVTKSFTKQRQSYFMSSRGKTLNAGEYSVQVQTLDSIDGNNQSVRTLASRKIFVKLPGLPFTISDLDLAIDQLQYIAKKDTLDEMRNAPAEKKRDLFLDFWNKRDPTQNTAANELMIEYYQRVEYSNKNFSHYVEGWKTDRGNVYIVFGEPNNIERHPFDLDSKPYEVWSYYELNREFVFIDETGFGDYRLRNPIWDVWRTRYR